MRYHHQGTEIRHSRKKGKEPAVLLDGERTRNRSPLSREQTESH